LLPEPAFLAPDSIDSKVRRHKGLEGSISFCTPADAKCLFTHRDAIHITRVVRSVESRANESVPSDCADAARAESSASMEYLDTNSSSRVPMPRYLTQHTLACLTRQGAEALAQRMQAGGTARAERVLVNMLEGKMFVEFRAESREALEGWLRTEGMHFDWLVRIEWEMQGEKLQPAD
jgi:hypothetical protein